MFLFTFFSGPKKVVSFGHITSGDYKLASAEVLSYIDLPVFYCNTYAL